MSTLVPSPRHRVDPELFAAVLRELEGDVRRRMAREEGLGGFFAFLCHAAPRYTSFINTLRSQHDDILRSLRDLRRRACAGSNPEALAVELEEVVGAILAHEQLEREVLLDALEG